ncbi:MAG: mycothiol synthase [Actinobacteria bacterium]|nr:mycothiol synthase [Actinomycetota bacterium]MBI3688851.1 mycothiol synthase [Actinomycetota bacterium]
MTGHTSLDPATSSAVRSLVGAAAEVDGTIPISEHVLLHLRHGGDKHTAHLLARTPDAAGGAPAIIGYAHLDLSDPTEEPDAELVVHPDHRRHGLGSALLHALESASADTGRDGRLRLWAHGQHPDATRLAHAHGYVQERVLWQLRRSLLSPLPSAALPEGVRLRPFRPGVDEQAWLAVNHRAFADHPEQGGWTHPDLVAREREPWFDPKGFLLAEATTDGRLLGFHWTKVHAQDPIGEVYVLGVDPSARGLGLGPALTIEGLRHLRQRGLAQVMLYVDESNAVAVRTYQRLGFTHWGTDVRYRRSRDRTVM